MQITIDRQGQQFGPYSMEEVKQHLASGSLLPTDMAWHEGLSGWVPLSELAGSGAVRAKASGGGKGLKIGLTIAGVAALACLIIFVVLPMFNKDDEGEKKNENNATTLADFIKDKRIYAELTVGGNTEPGWVEFNADGKSGKGIDGNLFDYTVKDLTVKIDHTDQPGRTDTFVFPKAEVAVGDELTGSFSFEGEETKFTAKVTKVEAAGGGMAGGGAAARWESLPDGAHIVGGADVIVQIKLGAIFNSPLVQQQLQKDPNSGMIINMMQQSTGIGPGDLQDLTLSISGLTTVAQSVDDPDALEQAMQSGFKSGALKIGAILRTSKPFDVAKIETLMTSEDAKSEITEKTHADKKYYLVKTLGMGRPPKDPNAPAAMALYLADNKTIVLGGTESTIQSHIDNADKISARSGLELIDSKQQIVIAYVPPDASALGALVTKAMANMPADAPPPVKALGESLKKFEAGAISVGIAGGGLSLVVSARFADGSAAKGFSDNFNAFIAEVKKTPEGAQGVIMLQTMGIQIPQASSTQSQAKLEFNLPKQALDGLIAQASGGGGTQPGGGGRHSQPTVQRWNGLKQVASQPQWPNYDFIVKNLGPPSNQVQNATLDLRQILQTKNGMFNPNLLTPQEKQQYKLIGARVDYFDDPQGRRAIRLYFRPQTQQLIGIEWFESGPQKIGPPGASQPNRPDVRPGGRVPGGRPQPRGPLKRL